jgi:hypothetical protein
VKTSQIGTEPLNLFFELVDLDVLLVSKEENKGDKQEEDFDQTAVVVELVIS